MKSSPEVTNVSQDALLTMTKAAFYCFRLEYIDSHHCNLAEFFIGYIAQRANQKRKSRRDVQYADLASYVQDEDDVEFLQVCLIVELRFVKGENITIDPYPYPVLRLLLIFQRLSIL
uniref:Uncharacterized protein n=1 Tax=Romanomermis culicivorax TaxID=13658 RepID=A0A915JUI4_ROMCU